MRTFTVTVFIRDPPTEMPTRPPDDSREAVGNAGITETTYEAEEIEREREREEDCQPTYTPTSIK